MSDRRRQKAGHRWIGLFAAVLLMTGGGLMTMVVHAVPAHAWDIEQCDEGVDCIGDPGGGSVGLDNGDCLWDSCGDGSESGDPDGGDFCTDSGCPDGQNPPEKQCDITIKDDGTLVCTVTAPGPDDPPPSDCPSDENCEDPITEQPIDPATCAPADDGTTFLFNQDNFEANSLTTDPFPDMDPLYNDLCPPPPVPPPAATQFGATDVAFGDSYISGEGAGDFGLSPSGSGTSCDVSSNAWPNVVYGDGTVASAVFATSSIEPFENWACTGATVSVVANQISAAKKAGVFDFNSSGARWAGMGRDTFRVEISAGGNDLGFSKVLKCAWHRPGNLLPDNVHSTNAVGARCVPTPARLAPSIDALLPSLTSLYESIDAGAASGPTVDVVAYPMFFPVGRTPACGSKQTGITRVDQIDINNDVLRFDAGIRMAAAAAGVNFIDFSTTLQGATVCDSPPGVNTLGDALGNFNPKGAGHPNILGHQLLANAYTRANFFPQAGASVAAPANGTLVGDRLGDDVYVAAGGSLFPFAKQAELSSSIYQNTNVTLEPSIQVATQLETPPADGTKLEDAATGAAFSVDTSNAEGVALIPLQSNQLMPPPVMVSDEALAGYLIGDGNFVKVAGGDGTVYQVVGGAPIAVTNWSHVGGPQPVGVVSQAQLNNLPQYPVDGTFVTTTSGTVYEFAGGAPIVVTDPSHVTGEPTGTLPEIDQTAIDDAGSGGAFNHIRQYPADGTFITATVINTTITNVYEFAGGAPVYVSDWSHVGGQPDGPIASIDQTALDNAGTGGAFNHVRPFPADGTYVTGMGSGGVAVSSYVFAGGAPIPITDWTHLGGPAPGTPPPGTSIVNVDETALDNAGSGGIFSHVSQYPANGTLMLGNGTNVFVVAGGAPTFVDNFEDIGGARAATTVDQTALDQAGAGGIFNHLRFQPADGTVIESFGTGHLFVIAGGAPIRVTSLKAIDPSTAGLGPAPSIAAFVDQDALDKAGSGGFWNHLNFKPADNTLLALLSSNSTDLTYFVVAGGAPTYVPDVEDIGGARASVFVDPAAINSAGSGGDFNHLSFQPADGTIIESFDTGHVYQVTGGVPVLDCSAAQTSLYVDQEALTKAGTGGFYQHLNPLPSPPPPPCPAPPPDPGPQL
jgi:hypothetical protein